MFSVFSNSIRRIILFGSSGWLLYTPLADASPTAFQHARQLYWRHLGIETAGLFWLAAELLILALLRAARRHVSQRPLPPTLAFGALERRDIVIASVALVIFAAFVTVPRITIEPLHETLASLSESSPAPAGQVAAQYRLSTHTHLSVWALFITAWVVLEIWIVYEGIRVYRRLRGLFHDT